MMYAWEFHEENISKKVCYTYYHFFYLLRWFHRRYNRANSPRTATANTADNLFLTRNFSTVWSSCQNTPYAKRIEEIRFIAHDGIELHGLWRKHLTHHTLSSFVRFYPAQRRLASFIEIAPTDCNLLFFDARDMAKAAADFLAISIIMALMNIKILSARSIY